MTGNGNDGVSPSSQRWLVRKLNIDCAEPVLRNVVTIDTGNFTGDHTCAVVEDPDSGIRTAQCWGENDQGQVGNGTVTLRGVPFPEDVLNDGFVSMSAGSSHTCGVTPAGGVRCWGLNFDGELGNGQSGFGERESVSVDVTGIPSGASQVSAGLAYSCAVVNGAARCWGSDNAGKLGNGTLAGTTSVPMDVVGLIGTTVLAVSAGFTTTCAVVNDGSTNNRAMCWGSDGRGALGDGGGFGGSSQVPVPVDFQGATVNVRGIDASTNFACAVVDEEIGAMTVMGKVKCWGDNTEGQLGAGLPTNQVSTFPVDVIDAITMTPIEGAVGISTGRLHACAVLQDGSLKCWGQNNSQQLGSTTAAARQTTAVVADRLSAVNVLGVSAGEANTCAVLEGNIAACWGFNMSFKNGNGIETGNQVTPHPVLVVP